jgi:hypothetical protein
LDRGGAGFVLVFRRWLFSGFDAAFGDDEDGYLALALIEHWRHVLSGAARWSDPIFFFPQHGTLGYTDTFLYSASPPPATCRRRYVHGTHARHGGDLRHRILWLPAPRTPALRNSVSLRSDPGARRTQHMLTGRGP